MKERTDASECYLRAQTSDNSKKGQRLTRAEAKCTWAGVTLVVFVKWADKGEKKAQGGNTLPSLPRKATD